MWMWNEVHSAKVTSVVNTVKTYIHPGSWNIIQCTVGNFTWEWSIVCVCHKVQLDSVHTRCCWTLHNIRDFGDYLCELLQVRILLRSTLCYRGEITSGSITVQALPGQLRRVGECSVVRFMWVTSGVWCPTQHMMSFRRRVFPLLDELTCVWRWHYDSVLILIFLCTAWCLFNY